VDAAVDGARPGHVLQGEITVERNRIDGSVDARTQQERLHLRCERQPAARELRVVERLDSQPVARQHQPPPGAIPQGDGEHTVQPGRKRDTLRLIQMDDALGVGTGAEGVSLLLELGAQGRVVVDLAVEDGPDGAVLVGEGLVAGGEVDNGEAAMAEKRRRVGMKALVVGTAVADGIRHALDARVGLLGLEITQESAYPAHGGDFTREGAERLR
jgi:hypothetical protein